MFLVFPSNIKGVPAGVIMSTLIPKPLNPELNPEAASAIRDALLSPCNSIDWQSSVAWPAPSPHFVSYLMKQRQPPSIKLSGEMWIWVSNWGHFPLWNQFQTTRVLTFTSKMVSRQHLLNPLSYFWISSFCHLYGGTPALNQLLKDAFQLRQLSLLKLKVVLNFKKTNLHSFSLHSVILLSLTFKGKCREILQTRSNMARWKVVFYKSSSCVFAGF